MTDVSHDFQMFRSNYPEVFCKKGFLINFAKFTGKHLCQSLFFNSSVLRLATLLKKSLWHMCFPVNFTKFLRTPFFYRTLPVAASEYYIPVSCSTVLALCTVILYVIYYYFVCSLFFLFLCSVASVHILFLLNIVKIPFSM